jgi:hypothetical protein
MTVNYYINGTTFSSMGVYVIQSNGIVNALKMKEPTKVNWPDHHGEIVDLAAPRYEAREISLECLLKADTSTQFIAAMQTFLAAFQTPGLKELIIEVDDGVATYKPLIYYVYLEDLPEVTKTWSDLNMFGIFTLKLREPEPVKRVYVTGPAETESTTVAPTTTGAPTTTEVATTTTAPAETTTTDQGTTTESVETTTTEPVTSQLIIDDNPNIAGPSISGGGDITLIAQSFTISTAKNVTAMTFHSAGKTGSPDFNVRASLYSVSDGLPNVMIAYSDNVISASDFNLNANNVFTFTNASLAIGVYGIVLSYENVVTHDNSNYISFYANSLDPYSYGEASSKIGIADWSLLSGWDLTVKIDFITN